jgi:hypothetical protein
LFKAALPGKNNWYYQFSDNCICDYALHHQFSLDVLRVFDLSGFVARQLSGCHSYLKKEVTDETDRVVTGDPEDEI